MVIFNLGNNRGYAVIEQQLIKRVKFEMFGKNFLKSGLILNIIPIRKFIEVGNLNKFSATSTIFRISVEFGAFFFFSNFWRYKN